MKGIIMANKKLTTLFNALTGKGHSELYKDKLASAYTGLTGVGLLGAAVATMPISMPVTPALAVVSFSCTIASMSMDKDIRAEEREIRAEERRNAAQKKQSSGLKLG